MKIKIIAAITIVGSTQLFSACSSIVSKSSYDILIDSEPSDTNFEITNRNGIRVASGVTPQTVHLKASAGYFKPENYVIDYNKEGYEKYSTNIEAKLHPSYFGNILIGGLIGMLIVDPATGAMYELPNNTKPALRPITDSAEVHADSKAKSDEFAQPITTTSAEPPPTKYNRVSFEGVYYNIEPGTVIGEIRVATGRERTQVEWTGQKNSDQFNELVELQLEEKGIPLVRYEDRLLKFDEPQASDIKVGMVIEKMHTIRLKSSFYKRRSHTLDMTATFKAYEVDQNKVVYEKVFRTSVVDRPSSRDDTVNAFPEAFKALSKQLVSDSEFISLISK